VTDIRLITDRHTKRSKGLAYVEFSKQEEVFVALALTGWQQQQHTGICVA
jgi:RNA-binding protein 39